jgi:hypothetical protein
MTEWLFLPPWGIRLVAMAGAVLVAMLALRAWRERRVVGLGRQALPVVLRLVVTAALVAIALNPTAMRPRETSGKPALTVLVDTSFSMATADVDGRSRMAAALKVLADGATLGRLKDDFTLDVRTFDKDSRAANLAALTPAAAEGRASDLGAALAGAVGDLADRPGQAGVLLVSDGRATTEGATEAARLALARSVPVWTWCLGGEVPRRDLWIDVPGSEVLAFAATDVDLSATFHEVGYENRAFRVELLKDGAVLGTYDVVPGPGGDAPVKARITAPQEGEHRYVFHVAEEKDQAEKANNERSVYVRVVGQKMRVLLAEGQPSWDTKFLVQSLKRNPRVELTAVYRLNDRREFAVVSAGGGERREAANLFPRTPEQFAAYDIIIMGRGCEAFFDDKTEENLANFVARSGGGLVFSRGKPYGGRFQPLAKLEPVVWGSGMSEHVRLMPTPAGRTSPVFELTTADRVGALFEQLPAFDQSAATVGVKPLAVILAGGEPEVHGAADEAPTVMAYQHYGQGRVVTVNASGLWRWAFREKASEDEEVVYERFWSTMLTWLLAGSDYLAGSDVALRSERRLYTDEQPMRFQIRTRGLDQSAYRPQLTLRGPGVDVKVEPRLQASGAYMAEVGPFPPGAYQVEVRNNLGKPAQMTMAVEVASSSIENRVLNADPELMRRLSDISEGRVLTGRDVPRLGEVVRQWRAQRELSDQKTPLWDHAAILAVLMAVMTVEWFLRRREGLL